MICFQCHKKIMGICKSPLWAKPLCDDCVADVFRRYFDSDNYSPAMHPLSFLEWIIFKLRGTAHQYPKVCGVHGIPTKGNRITGYKFVCHKG